MSIQPSPPIAPGTLVFVDTAAYIALAAERGDRHQTATAILHHLAQVRARLFTSTFVLAETHALLLSRLTRADQAEQLFEDIYTSQNTTIVRPSESDEQTALAIIKKYIDKKFSFTDAISFVVMERLGITHAFTFDRNFVQYGLITLPTLNA
jgi:uncharacterized protein